MSLFLAEVSRRYAHLFLVLVLDGAGWYRARNLIVPSNMRLAPLPARSPELHPTEQLWEELREKWLRPQLFLKQSAVERQGEKGLAALEQDPQRGASLAGFSWMQQIPLMLFSITHRLIATP